MNIFLNTILKNSKNTNVGKLLVSQNFISWKYVKNGPITKCTSMKQLRCQFSTFTLTTCPIKQSFDICEPSVNNLKSSVRKKNIKLNKDFKVCLVGNIKNQEKDLVSSETPLVHYASKNIIVEMDKTKFFNSNSKDGDIRKPLDYTINDIDLLKVIQNSLTLVSTIKKIQESDKNEYMNIHAETQASVNSSNLKKTSYKHYISCYASLAKYRLTSLVVLTSMAGYAMAPSFFDPTVFILCSLGTALTSSSANSINQVFEKSLDALMPRTQNRVLVRGLLPPLHAITFGALCGGSGIALLYFGVNELTAVLGALNLIIYTSIYTPLKQISIVNTWVGSIVGAIPPMMGWAGCAGSLGPGAFIIGGMLYAWQFPHFNALSWNIRHDYSKAGYQMMALTHPELCRRTALKYSASLVLLSTLAPIYDVTTWTFALDSLPLNLYFTYLAWKFYKDKDSKSSRNLFRFSLFHLPALLLLMLISKKDSKDSDGKKSYIPQVLMGRESQIPMEHKALVPIVYNVETSMNLNQVEHAPKIPMETMTQGPMEHMSQIPIKQS